MIDKEYHKNYYHTKVDKKRKVQLQRDRRLRLQKFVWDHLLAHPCVDCGESDPIVLEFDHVRGEKLSAVSNAVRRGWGLDKLKDEIAKCDVRCANCHRRVTAKRGDWFIG